MRRSHSPVSNSALVFSGLVLVWLTAHLLTSQDWPAFQWRFLGQTQEEVEKEVLLAENSRLHEALHQAQSGLAGPKAIEDEHTAAAAIEGSLVSVQPQLDDLGQAGAQDGFAYVFYATSDAYACSVLVNIHRLQHLLHVSYPIHVLASSDVSAAFASAISATGSVVHVEQAPPLKDAAEGYYQGCMLKLLAFKMQLLDPSLTRVLAFDSDQLIMRNLDPLFTGLPNVDLAAPRAYWLAKDFLASTFLMISLSERLWKTVKAALSTVAFNKFDMDLINDLLGDQVMMLSGEYVTLNSHWEDWNLPKWYHAQSKLNMTTVEAWNRLAKAGGLPKREETDGVLDAASDNGPDRGRSDSGPAAASKPAFQRMHTVVPSSPTLFPSVWASTGPQDVGLPQTAGTQAAEKSKPNPSGSEPSTSPRFPSNHPFTQELYRLQDAAAVIHFTAEGKPWTRLPSSVRAAKRDAHPLLAEQFEVWRTTASEVCPGGIPGSGR